MEKVVYARMGGQLVACYTKVAGVGGQLMAVGFVRDAYEPEYWFASSCFGTDEHNIEEDLKRLTQNLFKKAYPRNPEKPRNNRRRGERRKNIYGRVCRTSTNPKQFKKVYKTFTNEAGELEESLEVESYLYIGPKGSEI